MNCKYGYKLWYSAPSVQRLSHRQIKEFMSEAAKSAVEQTKYQVESLGGSISEADTERLFVNVVALEVNLQKKKIPA